MSGFLSSGIVNTTAIPDSGLQHRWNIDSGSGDAADSEGSNTWVVNGPTWGSGAAYYNGAYLSFDATDDWVDLSLMSFVSINSAFSIVLGVQPNSGTTQTIIDNTNNSSNDRVVIGIGNNANGLLETALYDGSSFIFDDYFDISSSGLDRIGDRILVTLTWDGSSSGAFYVDETAASQSGNPASTQGATADAQIGRRPGNDDQYLDSNIDFGLAYNRQLSSSEVGDIFNAWS